MELKRARQCARYVLGRSLSDLPLDMKMRLLRPGENEDSLLFRLVEKAAADIQWWMAANLENQTHEKYT
ncbi:MAG: hypothetical protein WAP23_02130 [Candidatus Spechtbacterales bacterium]